MGYHLLIVDDDVRTRNGLRKHVNWEVLGITEIEMAESAQRAFEILETFPCDIVLSDIRMRGMDGIQLCTMLKEKMPACQVVFISAYSDKEYLKAAIELGAACYVEKPIRPSEIVRAIRMAIRIIEQNNKLRFQGSCTMNYDIQYYNSKLLFALAERTIPYESIAEKVETSMLLAENHPAMRMCLLRLSGGRVDTESCRSELSIMMEQISGVENNHIYFDFMDTRNVLLLLSGEEALIQENGKIIRRLESLIPHRTIEGKRLFLAIGQMVNSPEQLYLSYSTARAAMKRLFTLGYGRTAFPSSSTSGPLPIEIQRTFQQEFERGCALLDIARIENALDQLRQQLIANDAIFDVFLKKLYYGLEERLGGADKYEGQWQGEEAEPTLDELETLEEVAQHLLRRARRYIDSMNDSSNDSSIVDKVMKIIQSEYATPGLSVSMISARIYLSPNYLSELFKQKTGRTIGQTITDIRMEHAKILMLDNNYTLSQISKLTGYNDPDYFAKAFKNRTGMTPSTYRKQVLSK